MASWMIPGMGGAMEHVAKNGGMKVLKKCTSPLTAAKQVNLIVTDMGVMEVTPLGLVLREMAPGITFEGVQVCTEAVLIVA